MRAPWNVVIVGGGPAGCATALALAGRGISRVCIVDAARRPPVKVGESIPPDTRALLQQLGVWDDFVGQRHDECFGSCSTWGSDTPGYNDFLLNPNGSGWHLDRARFDSMLLRRAAAGGATIVGAARLVGCEPQGKDGFCLSLSTGGMVSRLDARFVVDATGGRSAFARRVGAVPAFLDRLAFVYGFFSTSGESPASRLTLLEAVDTGWMYAARLPGGKLAVAFATDPDLVQQQRLSRDAVWLERLRRTRHVASRLDGCRFLPGSLAVRIAPSFLLDPVAGDRWLAAGDAAASYDPLSSQGIHNALADGLRAAEAIAVRLVSDVDATAGYRDGMQARFEEYRANRNYFYALEQRWADSTFWQRRRQRTGLGRTRRAPHR